MKPTKPGDAGTASTGSKGIASFAMARYTIAEAPDTSALLQSAKSEPKEVEDLDADLKIGSMVVGSMGVDSMGMPLYVPTNGEIVENEGVPEKVYATWLKDQLESENAFLQLPFTILVLLSFSVLGIAHLTQYSVLSVEWSLEFDIIENANFA